MNDENEHSLPSTWAEIRRQSLAMGFDMPSEARTAALLTVLAASKPGGRFLELGTGTGLATAALLQGMSHDAELVTVDVDATVQDVARRALGHDARVVFHLEDGLNYISLSPLTPSISSSPMRCPANMRDWKRLCGSCVKAGYISEMTCCPKPIGQRATSIGLMDWFSGFRRSKTGQW